VLFGGPGTDPKEYRSTNCEDVFVHIFYLDKIGLAFRYKLEAPITLPSGETATHYEMIYCGTVDEASKVKENGDIDPIAEARTVSYTDPGQVGDHGANVGGDVAFRFVNVSGVLGYPESVITRI